MTTTQTKWWWPIFTPWKVQQTFKQKILATTLFAGYVVIAILSISNTKLLGIVNICVPRQTDPSPNITDTCSQYDDHKTKCTNTGICTTDIDRGVLFGVYFFWVMSAYMFIGIFQSVILPQLRKFRKSRQAVSPAIPLDRMAISPLEYDAL
tara:strand:- start:88 stop:540 length:453 start_codon:yes stop_codon:yes gene_type:complete